MIAQLETLQPSARTVQSNYSPTSGPVTPIGLGDSVPVPQSPAALVERERAQLHMSWEWTVLVTFGDVRQGA